MKAWFTALGLQRTETIEPFCITPWLPGAEVDILTTEEALLKTRQASEAPVSPTAIFTDGSTTKVGSGVGEALGDGTPLFCKTIERVHHHRAELAAIRKAVGLIERNMTKTFQRARKYDIYMDSQYVRRVLKRPRQQEGQGTVRRIMESVWAVEKQGHQIQFHWVPGHSGVPGNEAAHNLALKAAARCIVPSSARVLCRAGFSQDHREYENQWREALYATKTGQFPKEIDKTPTSTPKRYTTISRGMKQLSSCNYGRTNAG
ncbi:ribonuclease H-like domain-containing protein [Rhypophila decipiens]|uniref:Ribonuclease H-like domain-containing protein n=1 Tax=Rhypophila decipiens TaxID=261697 RepID=A0AAN6Y3E1_9PEZI|nr:ribonuclease H-like domain-containing protein [Rhypophila decipiens]